MILPRPRLCLSLIAVTPTEEWGIKKELQAGLSQNSHWYGFNRCSHFSSSCFLYRAILPHQLFLLLTFPHPPRNKWHPCWAPDTSPFNHTVKGLKKAVIKKKKINHFLNLKTTFCKNKKHRQPPQAVLKSDFKWECNSVGVGQGESPLMALRPIQKCPNIFH